MNALKHGLRAESVVVVAENKEEFLALANEAFDYFAPHGFLEEHFVEEIVVALWKLKRCRQMEVDLFALAAKLATAQIQSENRQAQGDPKNTNPPRPVSVSPAAALASFIKEGDYLTLAHLSRYEAAARRTLLNALKELDRIQREYEHPVDQQSTAPVQPDSIAKLKMSGRKLPPDFDKPNFGSP